MPHWMFWAEDKPDGKWSTFGDTELMIIDYIQLNLAYFSDLCFNNSQYNRIDNIFSNYLGYTF